MIRREPQDLLEVGECLVHVVLVVEAEATDVDGVYVGAVLPQEVVGDLLGLAVAAEVSQALGPEKLEASRSGRNFQSAIEEVESLEGVESS